MKIIVLPGDGIGIETVSVAVDALEFVSKKFKLDVSLKHDIAGHESLKKYGTTIHPGLLESVKNADGLILGPMATYDFKDEAKGEINPSKFSARVSTCSPIFDPPRLFRAVAHHTSRSISWSYAKTPKAFTRIAISSRVAAKC